MESYWPIWLDMTVTGLLGLASLVTVILQIRRSPLAVRTTKIVSDSYPILPPLIGQIAFFYWLGWVRPREQAT